MGDTAAEKRVKSVEDKLEALVEFVEKRLNVDFEAFLAERETYENSPKPKD